MLCSDLKQGRGLLKKMEVDLDIEFKCGEFGD